jgi:hypothetical protein
LRKYKSKNKLKHVSGDVEIEKFPEVLDSCLSEQPIAEKSTKYGAYSTEG